MDNNISSYLISGIFDLPQDPNWKLSIHIPEQTFGVFVTIERNRERNEEKKQRCSRMYRILGRSI
jgi:hypothetical protein